MHYLQDIQLLLQYSIITIYTIDSILKMCNSQNRCGLLIELN